MFEAVQLFIVSQFSCESGSILLIIAPMVGCFPRPVGAKGEDLSQHLDSTELSQIPREVAFTEYKIYTVCGERQAQAPLAHKPRDQSVSGIDSHKNQGSDKCIGSFPGDVSEVRAGRK